jgi:hypothetical protein
MSRPLYRHPGPAAAQLEVDVPTEAEPVQEVDAVRWLSQMRADLAETVGGIMLRAARPVEVSVLPTLLSSSPGRLVGWSLRETSGTDPFVVRFRGGTDEGQPLIATAAAAAGTVDTQWLPGGGISLTEGLFVELVAGDGLSAEVEGTVYLGAAD